MQFLATDLKATPILGSFFGAMAYAVVLKVRSPWQMATIIFIGMVVAYFLGPLVVDWLIRAGFGNVPMEGLQNSAGFISGLGGMAICNGVLVIANRLAGAISAKGAGNG